MRPFSSSRARPPAAAPLRPADDAIMIDNTDMDFAASLELLLDVIRGRVAS